MKNLFLWLGASFVVAGLLSSCGGVKSEYVAPAIIIPPDIKTIAVRPFDNQTSIPAAGTKLWLAVTDEFIRDGRIAYVDDEAKCDGVIVGTIKFFRDDMPLTYNQNQVPIEFQAWVIMDVKFLDKNKNQYVWEEPNLEQKLRFFDITEPGGKTRDEAREELWARFASDIVRRTVEGFGTVSSASPRAVPSTPAPPSTPNPAPDYPSTIPF